jgi:peptidoglycan/xylan/chitin deacetylase (PgdA/CDA1 family)
MGGKDGGARWRWPPGVRAAEPGQRMAPAAETGTGRPELCTAPLTEPFPQAQIDPKLRCLSRGDPGKKLVALTFDDGPKPEYTLDLLAVLARYRVPATFFYVGSQCEKYPDLVRETYESGNEVGNHTYDHLRLPPLTREQKEYEVDAAQQLIARITGVQPRFFRPPGGHRDKDVEELLAQRGVVVGMWDVSLNDAGSTLAPSDFVREVDERVRPGSVILAHTGVEATIEALPAIIRNLRIRGYTFVTMSQLADGLAADHAGHGRGAAGLSNACFFKHRERSRHSRPAPAAKPAAPAAPVSTAPDSE